MSKFGKTSFKMSKFKLFVDVYLVLRKALEHLVQLSDGYGFGPILLFVHFVLFHNLIVAMVSNLNELIVLHIEKFNAVVSLSVIETLVTYLFIVNLFGYVF